MEFRANVICGTTFNGADVAWPISIGNQGTGTEPGCGDSTKTIVDNKTYMVLKPQNTVGSYDNRGHCLIPSSNINGVSPLNVSHRDINGVAKTTDISTLAGCSTVYSGASLEQSCNACNDGRDNEGGWENRLSQ